jgi:hypothetical protein
MSHFCKDYITVKQKFAVFDGNIIFAKISHKRSGIEIQKIKTVVSYMLTLQISSGCVHTYIGHLTGGLTCYVP